MLDDKSKANYQPWRQEEFSSDVDVRAMTNIQRWIYKTLLQEAWVCSTRPYLPTDDNKLWRLADCKSLLQWQQNKDAVLEKFERAEIDGKQVLSHKRIQSDWDHLLDVREAKAEAGRKSGEQRRNKSKQTGTGVEQVLNENEQVKVKGKEESKSQSEVNESSPDNGQEDEMKAKKEIPRICEAVFGHLPERAQWAWDNVADLERTHKSSAVVMDFKEWANENRGDDFPKGILKAYLTVASDRLGRSTNEVVVALKNPQLEDLEADLIYMSDDRVTFQNSHKLVLGELLTEFDPEEIKAAFSKFIEGKDLDDPKVTNFAAKNFVDAAKALCRSARRRRAERDQQSSERAATLIRLQEEAEAARKLAEEREKEEESFELPG